MNQQSGKIEMLRLNDLTQVSNNPDCQSEVVVQLNSTPKSFGFELRDDPNLNSRLAMLSLLTDAFIHKLEIGIGYEIEEGANHGRLRSIELRRY
ncbi:MAG TPA: hypothetical protein VHR47_03720 [Bacillota bacterium]|nr:hypothetical protein [Bacillota bacterium]